MGWATYWAIVSKAHFVTLFVTKTTKPNNLHEREGRIEPVCSNLSGQDFYGAPFLQGFCIVF
jgi:hypothetical protein